MLLTTVYILGHSVFVIVRSNQSRGKCYRPRLMTSTSILIISDISKTENKTKDKQTVARETLEKKKGLKIMHSARNLQISQLSAVR